jgi:hypothetical protein
MRTRTTVFAWDMLRSNGKLLAYPFIRIVVGFLLLDTMWYLIFDNSAVELGLLFVDIQAGEHGRDGIHARAFFILLLVMVLNGSFRAALDAIFKAVVWVWAEEGTMPESVDAKQLEGVFVTTHARTA